MPREVEVIVCFLEYISCVSESPNLYEVEKCENICDVANHMWIHDLHLC